MARSFRSLVFGAALLLAAAACADDGGSDDPSASANATTGDATSDTNASETTVPDTTTSAGAEAAEEWFERIPVPAVEAGAVELVDIGGVLPDVAGALPVERLPSTFALLTDIWAPSNAAVVALEQEANLASGADRVVRAEFLVTGSSAGEAEAAMVAAVAASLDADPASAEIADVLGPRATVEGRRFEVADQVVAVGALDDVAGVRVMVSVVDSTGPFVADGWIHPISTIAAEIEALQVETDADVVLWRHSLATGPNGPQALSGLDQVAVQLRSTMSAAEVDGALLSLGWDEFATDNFRSADGEVTATAFDFGDRIDIGLRRSLDYRED